VLESDPERTDVGNGAGWGWGGRRIWSLLKWFGPGQALEWLGDADSDGYGRYFLKAGRKLGGLCNNLQTSEDHSSKSPGIGDSLSGKTERSCDRIALRSSR
jgi:hypothetical protein